MRRSFLKELGIESEVIDKILDENMVDIGNAKKAVTEEMSVQIEELSNQLKDRDKQLESLKGVDAEALKAEIEKLQSENKEAKASYEAKIKEISLSAAVTEALREAGVKDINSVTKLLDNSVIDFDKNGKLTGVSEQLETLKNGEFTKVFFGSVAPSGTTPSGASTPPVSKKLSEMSYAELDEFMRANPDVDINTLE